MLSWNVFITFDSSSDYIKKFYQLTEILKDLLMLIIESNVFLEVVSSYSVELFEWGVTIFIFFCGQLFFHVDFLANTTDSSVMSNHARFVSREINICSIIYASV